jgi:predicted Zn-dependent protease
MPSNPSMTTKASMGTVRAAPSRRQRLIAALAAIALAAQPLGTVGVAYGQSVYGKTDNGNSDNDKTDYGRTDFGKSEYGKTEHGQTAYGKTESQRLPDLGDESQSLMSPAQERKIGEMVVRQIHAAGAYLDDPEVNDYLNDLGHRLVAAVPDSRQDFEFFAVADWGINAFALPGGYVGVNTGLILLTQTESELAAVLAHEISHVTQHHMSRSLAGQQRSMLYSLAALALALAMARSGSSAGGQAAGAAVASAQAIAMQTQINFTREHEYEADRIGFQRLEAAGFDVTAMATFMTRMQKAGQFTDGNGPSYLRTHPVTYERIAEAQARAYGKPYKQVPDSLDFQMVRSLIRSYSGTPREAVAYFVSAIADRKFNSEVAARYGLVASYLRAQDFTKAKAELANLEKIAPPHPMIEAMAGHVLMEAGDLDLAIARFKSALGRYPNKMQLIYDYPEALLKAGRAKEAAAFLDDQLLRYPTSGPLHRIAAQAYASLGKKLQQYQHQGEYYAWQGDLKGAVGQFELAAKAGDGDFYQSSMVETRLRALRRELTEQQELAKNG